MNSEKAADVEVNCTFYGHFVGHIWEKLTLVELHTGYEASNLYKPRIRYGAILKIFSLDLSIEYRAISLLSRSHARYATRCQKGPRMNLNFHMVRRFQILRNNSNHNTDWIIFEWEVKRVPGIDS
jgi:hypothetical protein